LVTIVVYLVVLGVELRTTHLLDRCFYHLRYSVALFMLFLRQGLTSWTKILLFVLPSTAGMTGIHHHTQPLAEGDGGGLSCELFTKAGLKS
jgi:hypothetical protein